ncbi:MAG: ribonuclease HI family protein [candidate division WOR-3 bacterium]
MDQSNLIVYVDGSSLGNPGPSGIGVAVFDKNSPDEPLVQISQYIGITTNNVAEYEALLTALKWLLTNKFSKAEICMDSELVYKQIMGDYRIKSKHLQILAERVRKLLNKFESVDLRLILRENNRLANNLAQKNAKLTRKKTKQKE